MKRMLTIAAVLMLMACMATAGPTNKGSMTLGGTVGFQSMGGDWYKGGSEDAVTVLTFAPNFGYFVADNIVIGLNLAMLNLSQGDYKTSTFNVGPMVGYYFGSAPEGDAKGTMLPYIKASFGILSTKWEEPGEPDYKEKGTSFGARVGADYFLANSVALDFGISAFVF